MNETLRRHPAYAEACQWIVRLHLVSHGPTQNLGLGVRDTSESPGGRRPPGSDVDRPRRDASLEERAAWLESYHRRTPAWFRRELERCETVERLLELRDLAAATVWAWKRAPMPVGQEPLSRADSNWKRFVGESKLDAGVLARRYGVTRQRIYQIRSDYRDDGKAA